MALISTTAANAGLAAVLVPGTTYYVSVNTASPGTTGANEMTGVTRAAVTFAAPSAGTSASNSAATVATPGTVAATHASIWSAATGGSFVIGAPLGSSVTAASISFASGAATFSLA